MESEVSRACAVAAMTDAELSEAVAREVFGLPVHRGVREDHPCAVAWPDSGETVALLLYPTAETRTGVLLVPSSGDAVVHVLEHMRQRWSEAIDAERLMCWQIESGTDGWRVDAVSRSFFLYTHASAKDEALGRAVFECALLAVRGAGA